MGVSSKGSLCLASLPDLCAHSVAFPSWWAEPHDRINPRRVPTDADAADKGLGRRKRVLVVDDEPVVADTVAEILSRSGFEARAVYSGDDAVRLARRFRPDIVLADVIMPDRSGLDTVSEIRELFPAVRVVLFSGQAETAALLERARSNRLQFELLPKPIHPRELLKKLRQ
jgi:CheY-like chemotaxis protein